jgi:alkane 1-monooxygenase
MDFHMKDLKYLAALTIPISAIISIYYKGYWSFFTPVYVFVIIPILELLLPQNTDNYSAKELKTNKVNLLFDWMLYLNLPIVFSVLAWALLEIHLSTLNTYEIIGLILSVGIVLGVNGINVAHELGHRQTSKVRFIGKLLLLLSLYMHFYMEHNFGHHYNAATKEDPATARYNQSIYSFWITSIFRQYISAWRIQNKLLKNKKQRFVSIKNDMLWYVIFQVSYLGLVLFLFGWIGLLFAISVAIIGFLLLETVNYIEHYGLLRLKTEPGRYERVKEIHSWNSNHVIGRIVLYELTRHSDHHYKSSKKYQLLECHDKSPEMPFGYPTSMVIAFLPPLWFNIMNKHIPIEMI